MQPRARARHDRRPAPPIAQVLVVTDTAGEQARRLAGLVSARALEDGGESFRPGADAGVPTSVVALAAALGSSDQVPMAVIDGALVTTRTVYGDVVAEPDGGGRRLRVGCSPGVVAALRVPAAHRPEVAEALLAGAPGGRLLDRLDHCAGQLGVPLHEVTAGAFPATLVTDPADAERALGAVDATDDAALRLRRASRADDGFLSTFFVRPLSRRLTRRAVARGLRPAQVTAAALVLGLLAALAYGVGGSEGLLAGSVLLLASLVVDCVDGEVARYTRRTSALGGWLDVGADRIKEYAVYAGLAAGATDQGADVWLIALCAMALLVTRHFVDFGFAAATGGAPTGAAGHDERVGGVAAWSARTDQRAALRYAKRAVVAPVGERTIALAVLAPLAGPRTALLVLLALGVVAAAWTTAGRVARTLHRPPAPRPESQAMLEVQLDAAPVPASRWLHGRLGWLLPAFARALEQGGLTAAAAAIAPGHLGTLFGWLAVVAFGQYEQVYRGRLVGSRRRTGPLRLLGWPVRVPLVLAALWLPPAVLTLAAAGLALTLLRDSSRFWGGSLPSGA